MSARSAATNWAGLDSLSQRPLLTAIMQRRTHRVSRGSSVDAGSMSYTSDSPRAPLTELEEAILIAITGCTGLTMPDRPFNDPRNHEPIMAKPNLNMVGRSAGSPDNAQGKHFFLVNDSGTYYLRKLPPAEDGQSILTRMRWWLGPAWPRFTPRPSNRRGRPRFSRVPRLKSVPVQP